MERAVHPGEFYRHFKNKLYQIVAVAVHSETGEPMVVYQALYGDFKVYVRPYAMFISEVDREKYPHAGQKYRFERVEPGAADPVQERFIADGTVQEGSAPEGVVLGVSAPEGVARRDPAREDPRQAQPAAHSRAFLRFLEAEGFGERMECLKELEPTVTQTELDSIYAVLDMKPEEGAAEEQVYAIRKFLAAQNRFDGGRLR